MLANVLTRQRKHAHRRRSARRSSVFGNALGNAIAGIDAYRQAQQPAGASTPENGIPVSNADISQQIAQDIGTPSLDVPNLAQNPSLDFSGFSGGTTTVGSAGAQGWWGVAQSVLGPNASNAAIEQWVQAAISANNGQTVLQQGQVVNLPGSDEIVTDAAQLSYDAANATYQAAQATASVQSEAALWGTIAGIGQEQSLQQMMDAPAAMGFSALQMQLADTNPNSAAGEQLQAQMQQANAESFKSFLLSTGFTPPPQGPLMQAYNPAAEQAYQANLNNIAYFAAGPVLGVGIPLTRALGGSEQAAADAGEMGAGLLLGAVGVPGDAALSEVANGSAADNIVP
ncbi:hypothetical protein, partial [Metallibacterium sp.]